MSPSNAAQHNAAEFAALRRRIGKVEPAVRKQLDREIKAIMRVSALMARGLTPVKTGRLAAGWKPSVTAANGAAIVNRVPYARPQEEGAKVWLRAGTPYRDEDHSIPANHRTGRPMRQAPAGDGRVVNEMQVLIRRSQAGKRAVLARVGEALPEVDAALTRAAEIALS